MKHRIAIVDAARGFAALYVMVSHIFWMPGVADQYPGIMRNLFRYGHQMVILFFLLSGFSIHFSALFAPLHTRAGLARYFWARFIRIYPLFLVAVLLAAACAVVARIYIDGNASTNLWPTLFFLSDMERPGTLFPVVHTNLPLWSLSYEVAYYAVYPLFWAYAKRFGIERALLAGLLLSACFLVPSFVFPNHFSNVFGLYWIWCFGAYLGELSRKERFVPCSSRWFYAFLAVLSASAIIIEKFPVGALADWIWGGVFGLVMLSYRIRFLDQLESLHKRAVNVGLIVGVASLAILVALFISVPGSQAFLYGRFILVFGVLSLLALSPHRLSLRHLCGLVLSRFERLGRCSYGVYVLHFPVLFLAIHLLRENGWHPYWATALLPAIMGLAVVLEESIQPRLVRFFRERGFVREESRFPSGAKL